MQGSKEQRGETGVSEKSKSEQNWRRKKEKEWSGRGSQRSLTRGDQTDNFSHRVSHTPFSPSLLTFISPKLPDPPSRFPLVSPFFIPAYESSPRLPLPNQNYSGCHCLPHSPTPVCSPLPPWGKRVWGGGGLQPLFHAVRWRVVIRCPLKTWCTYDTRETAAARFASNLQSFHSVSLLHFFPLSHLLFRRISYCRSLTHCCIVHTPQPPPSSSSFVIASLLLFSLCNVVRPLPKLLRVTPCFWCTCMHPHSPPSLCTSIILSITVLLLPPPLLSYSVYTPLSFYLHT